LAELRTKPERREAPARLDARDQASGSYKRRCPEG
jgi:hypothetical protein